MSENAGLTLTNLDLWNALVSGDPNVPGPLVELVALDTPLPASNRLRRSLRLAKDAFADLDADRSKLVEQYVKKDDAGNNIPTADGKGVELADPVAFNEGLFKLFQVEVTLPGAQAVKISELGNVKFSGAKLELLEKFVVDG